MERLYPLKQEDPRIAVLCIGNLLMRDEGVGPRVAAELNARFLFPAAVTVLDRATMGMSLLSEICEYAHILVVDAVDDTNFAPGTVVRFAPEDIAPYQAFHGAHDARFIDVLQAAELMGHKVEGSCVGVQVADITPEQLSVGLTPQVEAALPLLMHTVLEYLAKMGHVATDCVTGAQWTGERLEALLDSEDLLRCR
jgi:hydrogenase maturation protease